MSTMDSKPAEGEPIARPTWGDQGSLRHHLAALLDDVLLRTVTELMRAAYELAAGHEGTYSLGGRPLAPRISGLGIGAVSVDDGKARLLRADVTVSVACARGKRADPLVTTVAFVWSGRCVIAAGEPRAVDDEWRVLGGLDVSAFEDEGAPRLHSANRDCLDQLVDRVRDFVLARDPQDWGRAELDWQGGPNPIELWHGALTLEGHRMVEVVFADPGLSVMLCIETAVGAGTPPPRVLRLGDAWRQPLTWQGDTLVIEGVRPDPGDIFVEEALSPSPAAPAPAPAPSTETDSIGPSFKSLRILVAVVVFVGAVVVLAVLLGA